MTHLLSLSLCWCECSVIGVVTFAVKAGPSKRFLIVAACLMSDWKQQVLRQAVSDAVVQLAVLQWGQDGLPEFL